MKYKLIIFDLDGTILDTLDDLAGSVNHALTGCGLPERSRDEVRRFTGNGIRNLVERSVPGGTPSDVTDRVFSEFKAYYKEHCADCTKPYDGIPELLHALKGNGCLTAVVSNKADFAVQTLCEDYFKNMFDAVVGEKTGVRKKPAPDTVDAVLSQLHVDRQEAVYIGDSEVDIETAKNASMDCISVDWGFRSHAELIAAGATKIVSSPGEILNIV
jgi:phosphoglycolate phosphatase